MSSIVLRRATVAVADRTVLHRVDLAVGLATRMAVVGPNGVGKTTLLRVLAGKVTPAEGAVEHRPPTITVGLLPQERDRRPGESGSAYLRRRTGVTAAERDLHLAATSLADEPGASAEDAYSVALERYLALGGPDLNNRIPGILHDVGLPTDVLDLLATQLSGGQLARLALAVVLLARFDVLLLDEPTNDLDLEGISLLEAHLESTPGGLAVVSHDRAFLDRLVSEIAEIDEFTQQVRVFRGGWSAYELERERARQHARERYDAYEEKRSDLIAQARQQREWARAGEARIARATRAGSSGERDKNIRHAKKQGAQSRAAAAARIERALDRLEHVHSPREPWRLKLRLDVGSRSGQEVASLTGAVVRRGDFRLGPIDIDLRWGDRVAITGRNGSGKSTLLSALLGRLPLESGSQRLGRGVVVGEIGQVRCGLPPSETLMEAFRGMSGQSVEETRTLLAKFGLGADDVVRPVGSLSPGERTRAELALLVARRANLLVLDEPTNHLDLPAIEQLEQALAGFDGTLLLVSHDRRLLDSARPTHLIHVTDGLTEISA